MDIQLIGQENGNVLHIAKGLYRVLVSGDDTDGQYAMIEMTVPPAAGPGPHAHKDMEEVFYVVAGEIDFQTETGVQKAKAGDTIRIPTGGAVHAFKNTSKNDAKLFCTVFPAGLEQMFQEVSESDPSNAKAIGEKYGNEFFPPDYFESASKHANK